EFSYRVPLLTPRETLDDFQGLAQALGGWLLEGEFGRDFADLHSARSGWLAKGIEGRRVADAGVVRGSEQVECLADDIQLDAFVLEHCLRNAEIEVLVPVAGQGSVTQVG